jgi:tetratricopeptide (TPR) repeat protein
VGWRVAVLLAVALFGCSTSQLEDAEWVSVETPHFSLVSALSTQATIQTARDLEAFHGAVGFILGNPVPVPAMRTRVYAFDEVGLKRTFARGNTWSYFVPSLLGPAILLRNGGGWSTDSTHEYLFRSREGLDQPLWLEAGMAEFAGGSRVLDDGVEIGLRAKGHLKTLREELWIPTADMLTTETLPLDRGIFDAEAWALTHHLFFGQPATQPPLAMLRAFRQKQRRGMPPNEAFLETMDMTPSQLDRRLNQYYRRTHLVTLVVRPNDPWGGAAPKLRPLARDEVLAELGWISIDVGAPDAAGPYFESAVATNPRNARAEAGLGAVEQLAGRWENASAHFNRAIGMAPGSAATQLDVAAFYLARAENTAEPEPRARLLELAREHAQKSLEIEPKFGAANAMLAATHLVPGEDPEAGLPWIFRAQAQLPASLEVAILRGWLLYALDKPGAANYLARRILSRHPSRETIASAETLIQATSAR